jgi:hypothetical protein
VKLVAVRSASDWPPAPTTIPATSATAAIRGSARRRILRRRSAGRLRRASRAAAPREGRSVWLSTGPNLGHMVPAAGDGYPPECAR